MWIRKSWYARCSVPVSGCPWQPLPTLLRDRRRGPAGSSRSCRPVYFSAGGGAQPRTTGTASPQCPFAPRHEPRAGIAMGPGGCQYCFIAPVSVRARHSSMALASGLVATVDPRCAIVLSDVVGICADNRFVLARCRRAFVHAMVRGTGAREIRPRTVVRRSTA